MQNKYEIKLRIKQRIVYLINNARAELNFVQEIVFLSQVWGNIEKNRNKIKRLMYYENVNVFKTQNAVDALIKKYVKFFECSMDDFECSMDDFCIEPGIKGIYKGNCQIVEGSQRYPFGDKTNDRMNTQLIPKISAATKIFSKADKIVIVEKESVFSRLKIKNALVVCGKGFPDRNTLRFLEKLNAYGRTALCLVDLDPQGMHIFERYNAVIKCEKVLTANAFFKHKISYEKCIKLTIRDKNMLKKLVHNKVHGFDANFLL